MHTSTHTHARAHTRETSSKKAQRRAALDIDWLTSLPLLSVLLFILRVLLFLLVLFFRAQAGGSCHVGRHLKGLQGLGVAEGAAVVVEKPAEGELVEGVLWVLPLRGAEHVQRSGAVPAVTPGSGATLLLHGVEVGRVHRMGDLGPVGGRLLP